MRLNLLLLILLLFLGNAFGYTEGSVLVMSTGATTITVNNSGPLGGNQVITVSANGSQKGKVWLSTAGYSQRGSEQACADPCSLSINTEYGNVSYWYEITDGSGNPLSPPKLSSRLTVPVTAQPCVSSHYTTPTALHGFAGYQICYSFAIGNASISNPRLWMNTFNLRDSTVAVKVNGGAEHLLATTPIVDLVSDGTTCTFTTSKRHGLSVNDVFQLNFVNNKAGDNGQGGKEALNASYTVAGVPGLTTLTAPCTGVAVDWNTGNGGVPGQDYGKTISKTVFYADENKWFGGMALSHETFQIMVPISAGEIITNATNTITFIWKGTGDVSVNGLAHGAYFDWAVVQPDVEISQIVVTGLSAVATTTTTHGYSVNDTIIIRDAPGPKWRFNGKCVITATTSTTFTFPWGCGITTGTPGVAPYTTANGTYVVPTTKLAATAPQPHMYAARSLIPASAYVPYDPTSVSYGGNASNGQTVWQTTVLKEPNSWLPNNQSRGVCADCHTKDGSDLKYFGFGQRQVLIAGMHRGLSESDAKDVAAFIAANATPTPAKGRPWNPVTQPCPGLDSQPISQWQAGCGEEWTTVYDQDMREYVVPGGSYANWAINGNFNTHEIPTWLPMPTWMDWIPKTNPKDFFWYNFGIDFTTTTLWTDYQDYLTRYGNVTLTSGIAANATSMPVNDGAKIANNDFVQVDNEYFQVTAGGGTSGAVTLTVSPHQKGSTAAAHSSGVFVSDFTTFLKPSLSGAIGSNYVEQAFDLFFNPAQSTATQALGGNPQAAGYVWPSQYGPAYYDVRLWAMSRKWEIMTRFWLQNFLDQTYINISGSPNARAAAQYTRGWYSQLPFNIGPHKAIGGNQFFENHASRNPTNWNRKTARWYHEAAIIDAGDRFASGNFELDWPYYYAFNGEMCGNRPGMYMHMLGAAFQINNTWGQTALIVPGIVSMTLHTLRLNFPYGLAGCDLFTSESEEGELVDQVGAIMAAAVDPGIFSTANWQTFVVNTDDYPLSHVPQAGTAANGGLSYGDSVALGLAIMNHYGASSTIRNAIVTWANAVWASSGHDFSVDAAATCSYNSNTPPSLTCTNF